MTKPALAFHGNVDLAQLVHEQVAAHAAADEITQGRYWENGHGCFIGCIAHGDDINRVEELTGFPVMLTRIAENIFEALPPEKAKEFLPRMIDAPKVGADLSLVGWKFLHWCVSDTLDKYTDDKTRVACEPALTVVRDMAIGKSVTAAAARAAADAAGVVAGAAYTATDAAYAAYATARAVAYAADDAAAYAAYAANAAAGAADAAYTATDAADATDAAYATAREAYAAARIEQMEKLIELVRSAD